MWPVACLIFAAGLEIVIAIAVFRRLRGIVAGPLVLGAFLAALWAVDYALDLSSSGFAEKLLLLRLRFLFLPFYPLVWFEACYRFVYSRRCLYGIRLAAASIVPAITVIVSWLAPLGGFLAFQYGFWLDSTGRLPVLRFSLGPWSIVFFGFCCAISICGVVLLWREMPRTSWERTARRIFAAAYVFGLLLNVLFAFNRPLAPGLNYAPILAPITFGLIALALTRGRVLRLAPLARTALIENLEEVLLVVDHAGQIIDLNNAAALALRISPEKALDRSAAEVLAVWPEMVGRLRQGIPGEGEVRLGGVIHEFRILSVADQADRLQAWILILRDITERKQAEEQLRHAKDLAEAANEAKSRFLATMSHEIRTPMNAVLGFTDLLQSTPITAEQREYLDLIEHGGRELLALIDDILEYAKISSGGLKLEESPCNITELAAHVCDVLLPRATSKGITLDWRVGALVPPFIFGDPVRIGQILTSLIGNAVKFTEQGGVHVEIECLGKASGGNQPNALGIAIRVKDTGIGLAPDAASRSFEPFSQGDSSITRKYGGAGLGLAITRRLCELMGGNLRVDSSLGQGATFTAEIWVRRAPDYLV